MRSFPSVEEMSPEDFEKKVREWLSAVRGELKAFEAVHLADAEGAEGSYRIDVLARFEVFEGAEIKVVVECKKHKSPVERAVVQILHAKLASLGAHKGMVFSTSKFQSGAIKYAEAHGIALVQIMEGHVRYIQASAARYGGFIPADAEDYVGLVYGCSVGTLPELMTRDGCFKIERYFEKSGVEI